MLKLFKALYMGLGLLCFVGIIALVPLCEYLYFYKWPEWITSDGLGLTSFLTGALLFFLGISCINKGRDL
jgi:hypothetical protein